MGLKGLVVFNSAVGQMQDAAKNIEAINMARQRRKVQDFQMQQKAKVDEARLKNLEIQGQGSEIQNQMNQDSLKEHQKDAKTIADGETAAIDLAQHNAMQQFQQSLDTARAAHQMDPDVRSMVAMNTNPRLQAVQGPQGGQVAGIAESDNTPEAVNNWKTTYTAGGKSRIVKDNPKPDKKPSYNDVLKLATKMAQDDKGMGPMAERIKKYLPDAKRIVYNEPDNADQTFTQDKMYKQDTPEPGDQPDTKSKDKFGFMTGEEKNVPGRGKFNYIGNNKWQRQK